MMHGSIQYRRHLLGNTMPLCTATLSGPRIDCERIGTEVELQRRRRGGQGLYARLAAISIIGSLGPADICVRPLMLAACLLPHLADQLGSKCDASLNAHGADPACLGAALPIGRMQPA